MKQYIVIGAGRFGTSLAQSLLNAGQEVMVIDENEKIIQQLSETMDNVAIVSATDEIALKNIGLSNFDVAIVCIGSDLRASIMATLIAKDLGVPYVISKATDKIQADVLRKIGADRVVFPEHDMGVKLAKALTFDNLVDYMELDDTHSIFEITVPSSWIGSNLIDLSVRKKYNMNIVAVKRGERFQVPPDPNKEFEEGDIIVVAGNSKLIENIALRVSSGKW
ncbi:TrkA family potassium uptake protein [Peptostreptococcus russellii]|uniref:Trk system potassium uptake protein TrkA n=1 Tax=Peptostreptococcus russellii TaxID=215200 RepID=A0A1H8I7U5_9FIRM|nr:TrkA family potassium uptake protein [Peptostreptococcus russellii]MBC2577755.1 TrkA family potassium uptake protein [Peptostreptococcus russellii]SEN64411.1 trk system potassium uptake protein TrkA [Peptostreptococcus russellii]